MVFVQMYTFAKKCYNKAFTCEIKGALLAYMSYPLN